MKTNVCTIFFVMAGVVLVDGRVLSQPSLHVDSGTGLLVSTATNATRQPEDFFDPGTGLLWNETNVVPIIEPAVEVHDDLQLKAQTYIAKGEYEQALQCFLKLYAQDSLMTPDGLSDWVKLGRDYPEAARSLAEIRDRDAHAFSERQGTIKLFQELSRLNDAVGDSEATHTLFLDLRKSQPSLADDCYFDIEPALVQRGEYQLCLDCIGNPDAKFETYRRTFQTLRALHEGMIQRTQETRQKLKEFSQQPGGPPMPTFPLFNPGKRALRLTTDQFAGDVCRLIEILVATSHQEEAEKIRGEAVAVLDDPRLQSAVRDAEERIQKRSTLAAAPK